MNIENVMIYIIISGFRTHFLVLKDCKKICESMLNDSLVVQLICTVKLYNLHQTVLN